MAGETEPFPAAAVPRPLIAPDTPAGQLERLAEHQDLAVRAVVAAHPNTPAAVLGVLAADFPAEVLSNPALSLLRLAQPRLLLDWPRETLLRLIRQAAAPDWLRRHALTHTRAEYQVALASNPVLDARQQEELARHPSWQVRAKIAARPDLLPEVLSLLTADADYGVRLYVAARPDLPPASVERLRHDPSVFVRQVLAQTRPAGLVSAPAHSG